MTAANTPVLFALAEHPLTAPLVRGLSAVAGQLNRRRFPDGESYLRVETDVTGRACIVLADLSRPDDKYLPLIFLTETLRELGAASVGLVAPYLSYMRQDKRFIDGEAVTSRVFAREISHHVDWLVTVDPHLHRYTSLDEIYSIPNRVVQAEPALSDWVKRQHRVVLVGPDSESEQWVAGVAGDCPYVIGRKQRRGDRDVVITLPDMKPYRDRHAVIIDDVISSGHTLLRCIDAVREQGLDRISCAAVHGVFADNSDKRLLDKGIFQLITANTIPGEREQLDISHLLLEPIGKLLERESKS